MKKYWIERILGKLYGVYYNYGTYTNCAFEGTEDECQLWLKSNK
jgi:hypothetical protein